jgi:hypothetical protein
MKSKPTEGPWILNTASASYTGTDEVKSILGGTKTNECICLLGESDNKLANARLIAEAPNMYGLIVCIDDPNFSREELIELAQKLIKKLDIEKTTYKIWDKHNKTYCLDLKKENHYVGDTITEAAAYLEDVLDETGLSYYHFNIEKYIDGKYSGLV